MIRSARFDDFRAGVASGLVFSAPRAVLTANTPAQVAPALQGVEEAVRSGLWAAGFVAYEAAPGLDPALRVRGRWTGLPLVAFGLFDQVTRPPPMAPAAGGYSMSEWAPSIDRARYERDIAHIQAHITRGETYQVNHTFRLRACFSGSPEALYADLCRAQRSAYCAHLDLGRYHVVSASPELFFTVEGDRVVTRPMKGTAPRGRWSAEDERYGAALTASEKDRAENVMIVDLLRNDLGRVAEFGSVRATRLFELERYDTVWQLTSEISCRLRSEVSLVDMFRGLFPCGSVTGAPKVRTMQIIAETETSPRGVYTGAIGYLAPGRDSRPEGRFNVAIRTVVLDLDRHRAEYGVGGGITHDSSAAAEYSETHTKALVLTHRRPDFQLLETLRFDAGRGYCWLAEHLDRLEGSARYFGFRFDRQQAEHALREAIAGWKTGTARVRLTLDAGGRVGVTVMRLAVQEPEVARVVIDPEPVDPDDPYLFHKTTLRDPYERRRARWLTHDDVVLVNTRGEVTESTIANLAVLLDGEWLTPPLDSGCLPGVYRRVLLERGQLRERPISVSELRQAPALALLNSVRLWRPAWLRPDPAEPRASATQALSHVRGPSHTVGR